MPNLIGGPLLSEALEARSVQRSAETHGKAVRPTERTTLTRQSECFRSNYSPRRRLSGAAVPRDHEMPAASPGLCWTHARVCRTTGRCRCRPLRRRFFDLTEGLK